MRPGSIKGYVVGTVFGFSLCTSPGSAAEPTPQRSLLAPSKSDHRRRSWTLALSRSSRIMPMGEVP